MGRIFIHCVFVLLSGLVSEMTNVDEKLGINLIGIAQVNTINNDDKRNIGWFNGSSLGSKHLSSLRRTFTHEECRILSFNFSHLPVKYIENCFEQLLNFVTASGRLTAKARSIVKKRKSDQNFLQLIEIKEKMIERANQFAPRERDLFAKVMTAAGEARTKFTVKNADKFAIMNVLDNRGRQLCGGDTWCAATQKYQFSMYNDMVRNRYLWLEYFSKKANFFRKELALYQRYQEVNCSNCDGLKYYHVFGKIKYKGKSVPQWPQRILNCPVVPIFDGEKVSTVEGAHRFYAPNCEKRADRQIAQFTL